MNESPKFLLTQAVAFGPCKVKGVFQDVTSEEPGTLFTFELLDGTHLTLFVAGKAEEIRAAFDESVAKGEGPTYDLTPAAPAAVQ